MSHQPGTVVRSVPFGNRFIVFPPLSEKRWAMNRPRYIRPNLMRIIPNLTSKVKHKYNNILYLFFISSRRPGALNDHLVYLLVGQSHGFADPPIGLPRCCEIEIFMGFALPE